MMKWLKVRFEEKCGACGAAIYPNQPALLIELPQLKHEKRRRYRCQECAGPAPPNLPDVIVTRESIGGGFTKKPKPLKATAAQFTHSRLSDQDWVNKITGERD